MQKRMSAHGCGAPMWIARIEPDIPDHDKRTFECRACANIKTEILKYRQIISKAALGYYWTSHRKTACLSPIADMCGAKRDVRYGLKSDIPHSAKQS